MPSTTRRPYSLIAGAITNTCSSQWGYLDYLSYTIQDQLGTQMPSPVPLNEYWTSGIVNDYSGTNWTRGAAGSYTTPANAPASFADQIGGAGSGGMPTPGCAGNGTTKVDHWGQSWYIGTLTSGSGARVQSDTLQKYQDHAIHTGIISPNP